MVNTAEVTGRADSVRLLKICVKAGDVAGLEIITRVFYILERHGARVDGVIFRRNESQDVLNIEFKCEGGTDGLLAELAKIPDIREATILKIAAADKD